MEMHGEHRIRAPRQVVWDALNDAAILRECIPGCESLEKTSDTAFDAAVTAKVGPVKAKFTGHVDLSNINAPESYTIAGEGKGGVAGFAKGGADVVLEEAGPEETILRYDVTAQVGGKLAQLGSRLINATAKKMADDFFTAFTARVGLSEEPAEEAEPADVLSHGGDPVATAAVALEERAETAAGRGFLGGAAGWAWIAAGAVIVLIFLFNLL